MMKVFLKNIVIVMTVFSIFTSLSVNGGSSLLQETVSNINGLQELPANPLLGDYIAYALQHNPGLKSAYDSWMAKIEKSKQSGTMPEPELSYMLPVNEMTMDSVYEKQRISISQMFPWFGKLSLQEQAAAMEADAGRYAYNMVEREVTYKVVQAYYEYFYLSRIIENTAQNLQLLVYLEGVLRTRYSAAQAEYNDLLKLQVEIEKMKNELDNLNKQIPVYSARLSSAIGMKPGNNLPLPRNIEKTAYKAYLEGTDSSSLEANPSIKMLDSMIKASIAMEDRAGKEFFPDIMIGIEYRDMEARVQPLIQENMDSIMLMFTVNLPVKFGKYSSMITEAKYMRTSLEMKRAEELNRLTVSLRQALFMFSEAERRCELYEKSLIPKVRESVNVSMEAFIGGKAELMEFIDTERMLLEFEIQLDRAKADREIAVAEIEMLAGKKETNSIADSTSIKR